MSDEMHPAVRLRVRSLNGRIELSREAVGTIGGKTYAGIIRAVPDSPQPGVKFEKVEIGPEQSRNDYDRRSISARDVRAAIFRREPNGQELQYAKEFAKNRRGAGHLAVRDERLRAGGAVRLCGYFPENLHVEPRLCF